LLEQLIPGAKQISGADSDERKRNCSAAFASGQLRVLATKPKIGAWGLNSSIARTSPFSRHIPFEQYYQGVRRCWRFGQKREVVVDVIATEGEQAVMKNLQRKAVAADKMFADLVAHMNQSLAVDGRLQFNQTEKVPAWL